MPIRLENATIAMAADIGHIHAQSWKHAYRGILPDDYLDELSPDRWTERFTSLFDTGGTKSIMLFQDDRPLGCASYGAGRDDDLPGWGEVGSLYLLPQAMGKGYGRILMEEAVARLKVAGYTGVFVHVLEANHAARGFYAHMGMTPDERGAKELVIVGETFFTRRYVMPFNKE